MRVIGSIPHPQLKITVFETATRFPVQFEDGSRVQIFRLRRGGAIESLGDVKRLIDSAFCRAVVGEMTRMARLEKQLYDKTERPDPKDDLPTIL